MSALALLGASAVQADPPVVDNASMALERIEPRPEFPKRDESITVVSTDALSGADRRLWRDAEARCAEGRWREAVEKLNALLKSESGCVDALVLRARCFGRLGDATHAVADLAVAIRANPRHAAAHELAGEMALLAGDKATAIRELRLALDADPSSPNDPDRVMALLVLGRTLESDGYATAAVGLYQAFLDAIERPTQAMRADERLRETADASREEIRRRVAALSSEIGRHDDAIAAWRAILLESPDDGDAWRQLAHAQARVGDADAAFASIYRFFELSRVGESAERELDALCKLLKDEKNCETRMLVLVSQLGNADLSARWSERCFERGRPAAGMELLEAAAYLHPDRSDIRFRLAQQRAARGEAAEAFDVVVEALRGNPAAASQLANLLRESGGGFDTDAMVRIGEQRVEAARDDLPTQLATGLMSLAAHQPERAIEHLSKVTEADDKNTVAWESAVEAQIRRLDWESALDDAKRASAQGVESARLLYLKGLAQDALDEDDAAIESFQAAAAADAAFADPLFAWAEIKERAGQKSEAEKLYQRILRDVDPAHAPSRERLIVYYLNTGRYDRARTLFAQFERQQEGGPALDRCRAMMDLLKTGQSTTAEARLENYLSALRDILRKHPDDADTYIELARTYIAVSRLDDALTELKAALRVDDRNTRALGLLVDVHANLLDFAAAGAAVERLLKFRPRNVTLLERRINYSALSGESDRTIDMLKECLARTDLAEHHDRFTQQLIEELSAAQRFDEAERVAAAYLADSSKDYYRRNLHLEMLARADRHDEAVQLARRYFEEAPENGETRMQLLAQLQGARRTTEALQLALGWLADKPADTEMTFAVVRLCWTARQWDDAIEVARAAMEETDQPARFESLLSQTLQHARRFDEVIELRRARVRRTERLLEQAAGGAHELTLALEYRQANYMLIATLTAAGKFVEAERLIDSLLTPVSHANTGLDLAYAIDLRNTLSEIYRQTDRMDQAIEQLEIIYDLVPQDATANNNLSYTLADTGRQIGRAEKMVRFALSQNPDSSAALDTLGWVLYKRGEFGDAAYYLRRALRAAEFVDPVILDHLGDAMFRRGDHKEAVRLWRRAVEQCDPDGDPPPPKDRLDLHGVVAAKLEAHANGESPQLAPLALDQTTTAPASDD